MCKKMLWTNLGMIQSMIQNYAYRIQKLPSDVSVPLSVLNAEECEDLVSF